MPDQRPICVTVSILVALTASSSLQAQESAPSGGRADFGAFYVSTDLGVSLISSVDIEDYAPQADEFGITGVTADVDAGVAWNIGLGYAINEWFSVEVESGYYQNGFGGFESGEFIGTFAGATGTTPVIGGDGDFSQVPVFVNARASLPIVKRAAGAEGGGLDLDFTIGAGVVNVAADIDSIAALDFPGVTASIDGDSWEFGGQLGVGLTWELTSRIEFGVGYRCMIVGGANFGKASFDTPLLTGVSDVKSEGILTHAVQATFSIRF